MPTFPQDLARTKAKGMQQAQRPHGYTARNSPLSLRSRDNLSMLRDDPVGQV
ncbi:MAG: hypothetical protein ABWK01_01695 [Infirmifilum sp.]